MESVPAKWRGPLSGTLQEDYALGNLLAATAFWTIVPRWGWRPMFFIGGLPALLTLFIRAKVKEREAGKFTSWRERIGASIFGWSRRTGSASFISSCRSR